MKLTHEEARRRAEEFGQGHLLRFWDALDEAERKTLVADIAEIDFACVQKLSGQAASTSAPNLDRITAPSMFPARPGPQHQKRYQEAVAKGRDMLAANQVAAMVVAGGQGTRLGFDGPKGTLPISPVKNKTLFQLFAETIRATRQRYNCALPWYIMTSSATHDATERFFEENDFLGLDPGEVWFFQQGLMPAVDDEGRILLSERHRVALSPNGHGGSLAALRDSGVLANMKQRGITTISYFQVDNPLVSPADPLFLGLHQLSRSRISSIAVPKADDLEKVGIFARIDGKLQIIEYSDLPDELARARNADGSRMLDAGNVAIHLLDRAFVEDLTGGRLELPWHIARKKVPYVDTRSGQAVNPDAPNARKFEMFIFDAIPLAEKSIVLEQPRSSCFSPVKNADGVDSVATARRDMIKRAVAWLESCGLRVAVGPDGEPVAEVEIAPSLALDAEELKRKLTSLPTIAPGDRVYLE